MFAASKTAGAVSAEVNYIESVFSTFLYTGNGSTQTITNGIDLAGKGGLVWAKSRSDATGNRLFDTTRGATKVLISDSTLQETTLSDGLTAFNSSGFNIGASSAMNTNAATYVSWTFRKQPKFFDVVTYTGTGSVQNISHNLGSAPACMIVKDTTNAGSAWAIYHTSLGNTQYLQFTTSAAGTSSGYWNNTSPTSTQFTVGTNGNVNQSGATYVAYLFAHNAGGFGLTGTDNVISCGSFTTDGSGIASVTLGYEPQLVNLKASSTTGSWRMYDNMRGIPTGSNDAVLFPNLTAAEDTGSDSMDLSATGFNVKGLSASTTYIYIAIRRGPMKVPTSGTSVFAPITGSYSIGDTNTTGFPVDLQMARKLNVNSTFPIDRLRGISSTSSTSATWLKTNTTDAENTSSNFNNSFDNTKYLIGSNFTAGAVFWNFRRAPSFFDEVCYTGTGSAGRAITHNLGVAPELVIVKNRSVAGDNWEVLCAFGTVQRLRLNLTTAGNTSVEALFGDGSSYIAPTSTTFTVANLSSVNGSGSNLVAYLFATCAGVSKVGSYTGTGATQTISCGFTGGARFVLVKRTDSTGDWYVWDTARGMVSGTDPSLLLNSTAAEVNANSIYTTTGGFQIVSTAAGINASGGSYIYLAIA